MISANDNFTSVLESAYDSYDNNDMKDFIGIALSATPEFLSEAMSFSESTMMNEMAINVTNPHIVQEKKGKGISVTVNGKEYRYVSPYRSTEDLFRSFMGMMRYANAGYKALNYLKKNALCYYGAKNPQGKDLIESDTIRDASKPTSVSISDGTTGPNLSNPKMHSILVNEDEDDNNIEETTQPSAVPPSVTDIGMIMKPPKHFNLGESLIVSGGNPEVRTEPIIAEHPSGSSAEVQTGHEIQESVIDINRTGMTYYNDFLNNTGADYKKSVKGLIGKIEYMSPDEYIARMASDIFLCSVDRVMQGANEDLVQKYADQMNSGEKFDLPILDLANKTQEGRHRVLAAKRLGVEKLPVLIVSKV